MAQPTYAAPMVRPARMGPAVPPTAHVVRIATAALATARAGSAVPPVRSTARVPVPIWTVTTTTVGNAVMPVNREQLVVMACVFVDQAKPTAVGSAWTPIATTATVVPVAMPARAVRPARVVRASAQEGLRSVAAFAAQADCPAAVAPVWIPVMTPTTVEAAAMAALPVQPARTASVSVPPVRPTAMEPAPTPVVIPTTVAPVAMPARVVQPAREAPASAQEVPHSVAAAAARLVKHA